MRSRPAPPTVHQPGGLHVATARPVAAGAGRPVFKGITSGLAAGSLALAYPDGTAVGDLAVVFGAAANNLVPDGVPDPFLLTGSPTPYAGTGPIPYSRYLDPANDAFACSWGTYPFETSEGLRHDGRRFFVGRTVTDLGDTFSVSSAPGTPEIVGFLLVFSPATVVAPTSVPGQYWSGWVSPHLLAFEGAGFGAAPPYAWPKLDYTTDIELGPGYAPLSLPAGNLPYYLLHMVAPVCERGVEGVGYPWGAVPQASYTDMDPISTDYSYTYGPWEVLASHAGARMYMAAATPGQDPIAGHFSEAVWRQSGTVSTTDPALSGYYYSYLAFDPIFWAYMHQQFRFVNIGTMVWTSGAGAPVPTVRPNSNHLAATRRYQRFPQGV